MRALVILLVTSAATVTGTWICLKFPYGFLSAWVMATAIILVAAMLTRGKRAY